MIPAVVIILAFFPSKFLTFQKEVKRIGHDRITTLAKFILQDNSQFQNFRKRSHRNPQEYQDRY